MATNVFGNPVTNKTLEAMPEYEGKKITQYDRAEVALNMIRSEKKAVNARTYLDNLKASFGNGVSTKCLIYNATGDNLTLVKTHDWAGHIGESPYPTEIGNGQWGAFFHVKKTSTASDSSGAVVYRLTGPDGAADEDCMAGWRTAFDPTATNKCYGEIREKDHFEDKYWSHIGGLLQQKDLYYVETQGRFEAEMAMGGATTVLWEVVIKLNRQLH